MVASQFKMIGLLAMGLIALGSSPASAQNDASSEQPEVRVVELFEALAVQLEDHSDCAKVETSLLTWADAHKDELPDLVKATADADRSELSAAQATALDARLQPAMHTIFAASMACGEHEGTLTAMETIDRLLNPGAEGVASNP